MNFKALILLALGLTSFGSSLAECPDGLCRLKKIAAYRIINPKDRVITGYKVNSRQISLMIHLNERPNYLYSIPTHTSGIFYNKTWPINGFHTQMHYAADKIDLSVNNKTVNLKIIDHKGRTHIITSNIPHPVNFEKAGVTIKMHGNTVEVSMPRS